MRLLIEKQDKEKTALLEKNDAELATLRGKHLKENQEYTEKELKGITEQQNIKFYQEIQRAMFQEKEGCPNAPATLGGSSKVVKDSKVYIYEYRKESGWCVRKTDNMYDVNLRVD